MAIDSTSTLAAVTAQYVDNADFDDSVDSAHIAKAKLFRHACRVLLVKLPKVTGAGSEVTHLTPDLIQKEIARVNDWLASNDSAASGSVDGVSIPAGGPSATTLVVGGRE
jgi:hypothetical protein